VLQSGLFRPRLGRSTTSPNIQGWVEARKLNMRSRQQHLDGWVTWTQPTHYLGQGYLPSWFLHSSELSLFSIAPREAVTDKAEVGHNITIDINKGKINPLVFTVAWDSAIIIEKLFFVLLHLALCRRSVFH